MLPASARTLSGKRGAGVPGYGVPGCGKHGVWWKTRGLVENAGSNLENFVRKKTIQVLKCFALVFFWGVYFVFRSKKFVWEKKLAPDKKWQQKLP